MRPVVFYLAGDSYPLDRDVEIALRAMFVEHRFAFVSHDQILNPSGNARYPDTIADRLALLERAVSQIGAGRQVFLIGRSSGARIVTLLATRIAATAVICIGYPFRHPGQNLEPERFEHLATLTTPTLIIQGSHDVYGGLDLTEHYTLNPSTSVAFFQGDHEFYAGDPDFDAVFRTAHAFIEGGWRRADDFSSPFDEAFYLSTHPDVANAVAINEIKSGEEHFRRFGRQEQRRHRLLPKLGPL